MGWREAFQEVFGAGKEEKERKAPIHSSQVSQFPLFLKKSRSISCTQDNDLVFLPFTQWSSEDRFLFEERAAILEFEAGFPKNIAEQMAELMMRTPCQTVH